MGTESSPVQQITSNEPDLLAAKSAANATADAARSEPSVPTTTRFLGPTTVPRDRLSPRPLGTVRCWPRRKIPNPAGWLEPNLGRGSPPQARKPQRTLPPAPRSD